MRYVWCGGWGGVALSVIPNVRCSGEWRQCTVEQVLVNKFVFVATCLGTCDVRDASLDTTAQAPRIVNTV